MRSCHLSDFGRWVFVCAYAGLGFENLKRGIFILWNSRLKFDLLVIMMDFISFCLVLYGFCLSLMEYVFGSVSALLW